MDLAAELLALGAATIGESGGLVMSPRLRPAWPGAAVAAPAYPVTLPPADNLALHAAVVRAPAGSVLVVDASSEPERGYWGEVLTTAAESRGLAGLVIDGGVRDVVALQAHAFPVFSALVALRGAVKVQGGSVGLPATVDVENTASMGWQLVQSFVAQLHGRYTLRRQPGTVFTLTIPERKDPHG